VLQTSTTKNGKISIEICISVDMPKVKYPPKSMGFATVNLSHVTPDQPTEYYYVNLRRVSILGR